MAHSEGENLPLSQDSYMESDEGNFSSDDSLLDDGSDEDYNPSNEDFIEDDEYVSLCHNVVAEAYIEQSARF